MSTIDETTNTPAPMNTRQDVRDAAQQLAHNPRATATDVHREAQRLGVPTAALMAVMDRGAQ